MRYSQNVTDTGDSCPGLWGLEDYDILLLPSITVSFYETRKLSSIHEERHLSLLNLLKNKNSRIIFVMSSELDADIIKYRLGVFKKAYNDPTADERLILLSANDTSSRPLTEKILENEHLIKQIQSNIRNPKKSIMLSYICSKRDLELRNKIGIPMWFGSASQQWGSKSGSRQIFAESDVPIAEGMMKPVYTLNELEQAILQLWHKTRSPRLIVKMDDGSGGNGNIVLDFSESKSDTTDTVQAVLKASVEKTGTFEQFLKVVEQSGVIVEQMMDAGKDLKQTTPSVQLYIHDESDVQVLSSHEQVVNGCIYLGCRYPANKHYLDTIVEYSKRVGKTLASKGVRGFLGVDYLANQKEAQSNDHWDIVALEINIRLCATTFSYFVLTTIAKEEDLSRKHYVMLDELHINPRIANFRELDEQLSEKDLSYNSEKGHGIVLVTCSRLKANHEVSVLVVANSRREVDALLDKFLGEFADEDKKHFVHSRSNSPVAPLHLGDSSDKINSLAMEVEGMEVEEKKERQAKRDEMEVEKGGITGRVNEQGVALAI